VGSIPPLERIEIAALFEGIELLAVKFDDQTHAAVPRRAR